MTDDDILLAEETIQDTFNEDTIEEMLDEEDTEFEEVE
jgi:hypothetical protein